MRIFLRTADVMLTDRKRCSEISKSLGVMPIVQKVKAYTRKWRSHVGRMKKNRSSEMVLQYTSIGGKKCSLNCFEIAWSFFILRY